MSSPDTTGEDVGEDAAIAPSPKDPTTGEGAEGEDHDTGLGDQQKVETAEEVEERLQRERAATVLQARARGRAAQGR